MNPSQLKYFADLIQKEIGIIYSDATFFQLEKRLIDIAKVLNLADVGELYALAQRGLGGTAKQVLLDVATNNETSFYRDPKAFRLIENHIIPHLVAVNPGVPVLRIWCAASSFGQEPYSLAILLREMAEKNVSLPRMEILATDISEAALARAKEAKYTQLEVQRGLSAVSLVKYFTKSSDDYWTLNNEIRMSVQFRKQNLLDSFSDLGTFDFILCRNVLIYQSDVKKKEIVAQMTSHLSRQGAFLLGAAESLLGVSSEYDQVSQDGAIFYRKKVK